MYEHYGRIGDIWKHLPLVSVLSIERPARYVETNSSRAEHSLTEDWRRDFGIGHFLCCLPCRSSLFATLEIPNVAQGMYLGSPGLAMKVLGRYCSEYVFCDVDTSALANIEQYAEPLGLHESVRTVAGDSRSSLLGELETWGAETLIHIDPYDVLDADASGNTYVRVFEHAACKGIKLLLWYGYATLHDRENIDTWWGDLRRSCPGSARYEVEFAEFALLPAERNPGVWGCGIVIANLSSEAIDRIERDHQLIGTAYRSVTVEDWQYRMLGRQFTADRPAGVP